MGGQGGGGPDTDRRGGLAAVTSLCFNILEALSLGSRTTTTENILLVQK